MAVRVGCEPLIARLLSRGAVACGTTILMVNRSWFRARKQELPLLAAYGLVSFAVFYVFYLYTVSITTVTVSVVLLYTAPAFAAVMARLTFGEAITRQKVVALLLCFAGCVLVAGLLSEQPAVSLLGVATGIGSALTYASFGIIGKHAWQRLSALTIQFYSLGFATLFLTPALAVPGAGIGPYPWEVWGLMLALGAVGTMLLTVLYTTAVKQVEASRAAIIAYVEPVTASLFAYLFLGELLSLSLSLSLSPAQIAGGCLVLAESLLAQGPTK